MTIPPESQWVRVEEMVDRLRGLEPERAQREMEALQESGEAPSVLNLVRRMLLLPALPEPLKEGDVLANRYTLREKLGEGAMGAVWRATHGVIGHDVALKMIHFGLLAPELASRFQGEMEILGRLEHRGIVRIVDAGFHRGEGHRDIPYLAMDLVHGVPLNRWAAEHRGELGAILQVAQEVCAAVQHAHDRMIIHRDLKPSNILVRMDGAPVILDFGLARAAGVPDEDSGLFCGTPEYAAPEQFFGADRGFRSGESVDVYAVGAILFEMLAGRRLFEPSGRPTLTEMSRILSEERPARLAALLPACPPLLDEVVARAVRRDPADRYYSIGEFARALSRVAGSLEAPVISEPPRWIPAAGAMVPGSQWRMQRKLGAGSSGEVWLGIHEQLGERRVFKFCESLEKARTLKRELTLYRLLKEKAGRSPHFIPLHEVSLEEPPWYLMMDYVEAEDLEQWCTLQPGGLAGMARETIVEIVAQVAEALQSAHESGILHRDIKPANILVSAVDSTEANGAQRSPQLLVRVADFGIGRIVADELQRSGTRRGFTYTLTDDHHLSGTLLYMAPEVIEGGEATARSDVYSLGVILWQMLAQNFHAALDPTNWLARIADPLLREDLMLCLAGQPDSRWSSAGAFAASLRSLAQRRDAKAQSQARQAALERAAYRKGILRTASIAAVILAVVIVLAINAWTGRTRALHAQARGAMEAAGNLIQGNDAGRRQRGLSLLAEAARFPDEPTRLRSLAAGFLALQDLQGAADPLLPPPAEILTPQAGAAVQTVSAGGGTTATGAAIDDVQGLVTLTDSASGKVRGIFRREAFPWIPIPESGFLQFSPDEKLLAIAGPETSMHILFCKADTAELQSFLYVPGRLRCMAWHPGNRLIATGGTDRIVKLWDLRSTVQPELSTSGNDFFKLPPTLAADVIESPAALLEECRGQVCAVAFHPDGTWLAALDDVGWLRIWSGLNPVGLPDLSRAGATAPAFAEPSGAKLTLLVQTKLERSGSKGRLQFFQGNLFVTYPKVAPLVFRLQPGNAFREAWIAPGVRKVAWSGDDRTLCAITDRDAYLLARDAPEAPRLFAGTNPSDVGFDSATQCWVLPNENEYILRSLSSSEGAFRTRLKLASAEKDQGFRFGMAVARNGRTAIYFAKRLQFFHHGKPEIPDTSIVADGDGGAFQDLLWDPNGSLATIVYASHTGLRAENYATTGSAIKPAGIVSSSAQRLISAGDGRHLIERGIDVGVGLVSVADGTRRALDASNAARQDAPLAVSADGKWIAAVFDQNVIRLMDAATGTTFADLAAPRMTSIVSLTFDSTGEHLATITRDGYVQVWSFPPWRDWLQAHGLAR